MKQLLLSALAISLSTVAIAQPMDLETIEKIKNEGIENSQIMETMSWLTDVYGPRLTNSSQIDRATDFAIKKFNEWGLDKAEKHSWGPFGKSWELERFALHATSEYSYFPVLGYPKAWSPGYKKAVKGDVVILKVDSVTTLDSYKGKLKGKFVLIQEPLDSEPNWKGLASRQSDERLLNLANSSPQPPRQGGGRNAAAMLARQQDAYKKAQFLQDEKPFAIIDMSYRGWGGQVAISGAVLPSSPDIAWGERPRAWDPKAPEPVPQVSLAREHYGRLYRMIEKGVKVEMEMELKTKIQSKDVDDSNVIGEITGTDPELKDEIVMLGAHIDSWHTGTGATDNGAGSAIMMEAVRILKAVGVQPRRTIRIGLWSGEEQGLFGSFAYVNDAFAQTEGGYFSRNDTVKVKKDYNNFSAYFNVDNGGGQIRGIYLQENEQLRTLFRSWLQPFSDWNALTVAFQNTGGTDHLAFDRVGLPGFQFIQDPIEYGTLTHHSNMDVYERIIPEDVKRNAVIVATFVYLAAQMDEKLERKPNSLVIVE